MSLLEIILVIFLIVALILLIIWLLNRNNNPSTGTKCSTTAGCPSGQTCDSVNGICVMPIGGACDNNHTCISGSSCTNNVCVKNAVTPIPPANPPPNPSPQGITTQQKVETCKTGCRPTIAKKIIPPAPKSTPPPPRVVKKPQPLAQLTIIESAISTAPSVSTQTEDENEVRIDPSSALTSNDEMDSDSSDLEEPLSTPYVKENDKIICKFEDAKDARYITSEGRSVIDVVSFSAYSFFLFKSGNIVRQNYQTQAREMIKNNIKISRLESFGGYIRAISDGFLYVLDNQFIQTSTNWDWKLCEWSPSQIIHTSVTIDGQYLWIQRNDGQGMIFNKQGTRLEGLGDLRVGPGVFRNYGRHLRQYVDYNPKEAWIKAHDGDKILTQNNICVALYNNYDKIVVIKKDEYERFKNVRLVNWVPHYIA